MSFQLTWIKFTLLDFKDRTRESTELTLSTSQGCSKSTAIDFSCFSFPFFFVWGQKRKPYTKKNIKFMYLTFYINFFLSLWERENSIYWTGRVYCILTDRTVGQPWITSHTLSAIDWILTSSIFSSFMLSFLGVVFY